MGKGAWWRRGLGVVIARSSGRRLAFEMPHK